MTAIAEINREIEQLRERLATLEQKATGKKGPVSLDNSAVASAPTVWVEAELLGFDEDSTDYTYKLRVSGASQLIWANSSCRLQEV